MWNQKKCYKKVTFYGKVTQIIKQNDYYVSFRMYVTQNCNSYNCLWDDDIFVTFEKNNSMNILEDDMVNIYGDFLFMKSYETTIGSNRTIPYVNAKYLELN